jgi:plasmid maintenance system killer protein
MATLEYTREQFAERIGTRKRTLDNWRLTFRFDGDDAEIVDYQDYH